MDKRRLRTKKQYIEIESLNDNKYCKKGKTIILDNYAYKNCNTICINYPIQNDSDQRNTDWISREEVENNFKIIKSYEK